KKTMLQLFLIGIVGFFGWVAFGNGGPIVTSWFVKPAGSFEDLLKADKLDQAKTVLDKRMSAKKITSAEQDKINDMALLLARKLASDGRYKDAIDVLNKIPRGSKAWAQADRLRRKYRLNQTDDSTTN
ncbi:MAG: hypothetical protein ACRD3W_24335, partial [Terriglobales bacterium]